MPPRKRNGSKKAIELQKLFENHDETDKANDQSQELIDFMPNSPSEYFEFNDADLKQNEPVPLKPVSLEKYSEPILNNNFSRKIKLLIRKTHLICELVSAQVFAAKQLKNSDLAAFALSCLPPHILRIFDPKLISEGMTLKNNLAMFSTWWKNNVGHRMVHKFNQTKIKLRPFNKLLELKCGLLTKSIYEDDSNRLFAIICHSLGLKIRFIHSLDLIPASVAKTLSDSSRNFQHVPRYWLEVYSNLEQKWIIVDCIQGLIDEKNKLENKTMPHSFVLAVDENGLLFDLTEKYSTSYQEKSFKLRKDEDKWLKDLIVLLNSKNNSSSKVFVENDCSELSKKKLDVIEIPKTLSAIKNHPFLMLESQLKKYEVFYPITDPVGYFKDEAVFLKENVKKVRSKDAWLSQVARVVKTEEEPAKLVNLPRKAGAPIDEPTGIQPLYGEWQTEPYVPPEVIDGKVPRNDHGNVDLFQSSMLPKGCTHVTLPGAWKVARFIGIDYADACIGFSFHGGRALPSIHGIVITNLNYEIFQREYKNKLIESFKSDSNDLERQIAQKWIKIIKNALIARRLKHDSSVSISESFIPTEKDNSQEFLHLNEEATTKTISSLIYSPVNGDYESEIEGFDEI